MDWKKKEYWLVLCLIGITTVYSYALRYQKVETTETVNLSKIPDEVGDWVGDDIFIDENVLDELKADKTIFRRYVNSHGNEIRIFLSYWKNQKYGAQPHSPLHCLPGGGWNIISRELTSLNVPTNGKAMNYQNLVNFATIANGKNEKGMLYWYQTRSGILSNELKVKIDLAKNSLLRKPTDAAFIRIMAPMLEQNRDITLETLQNFWHAIKPYVDKSLPF